jgi:hypothetical protein
MAAVQLKLRGRLLLPAWLPLVVVLGPGAAAGRADMHADLLQLSMCSLAVR